MRFTVVALLACASLITWLPDVRRDFGHPLGDTGVVENYRLAVIDVTPQAGAAGIKVGDSADLRAKNVEQRLAEGIAGETADPGTPVTLALISHGRPYAARVVTVPEVPNVPVVVLRQLSALLMLFLGAFLVLKRPNVATWAFFIFSLNGGGPSNIFLLVGPAWWRVLAWIWVQILVVVPPFFGAIFALHLLHEGPLPVWRRRLEILTYAVMVATGAVSVASQVAIDLFGINWGEGIFVTDVASLLAYVAIPLILIATYSESHAAVRERLRWVIWVFSIAAIAFVADLLGSQGNLGLYETTYFEHSLLTLAYTLLVAVAVLYTILKHRIIDVNVAISRAVVYAALSTIIVGIFALVDMFFSSALSAGRVGLMADMGLALILGFSFNALHARVDRFMDWVFFRARHRAEQHVATVASAIPYARTEEHVTRMLIDEPVRAFSLAEGMLTRVRPDGKLHEVRTTRRHGAHQPTSDPESLVAILRAQRRAWRLSDQHMSVAVPIFSDADLEAIAFYAPHSNGTEIDSDELALIERAADAAGGAYARFKSSALRERVAQLEDENAQLKAAVTA